MSEARAIDLHTLPLTEAIEAYSPNFRAALPSHIPLERFKRVVVLAVSQNPDLARADRRSLFNACVRCAQDGLYPDGREAALVIYNTKINIDGQDRHIKAAQYLPMIAGIRKRMRNSGDVLSAEAHVVYEHDEFKREFGDNPSIVHKPPPFGVERGKPVGAYAVIKLASGETLREVMDRAEIDRARQVSRSKDRGPWVDWWDEMARKTVLRRCAKSAPISSEIDRLLTRDDQPPEVPTLVELPPPPPRPRREDFNVETGEVAEPPRRRGRPPKIALPAKLEPDPELLEQSLDEQITLGLAGAKSADDVAAVEAEHKDALGALEHDQWLPLQEKIDRRRAELT